MDDKKLSSNEEKETKFDTKAIRTGHVRTMEGEHSEPLFLTSSYVFKSAKEAAARFSGDEPGNVYTRYTNPTVQVFEKRLAALECAECAVATSSGMAAILSTCMALLESGDHIVCSYGVFGSTVVLFDRYLKKFGITVSYVPLTNLDAWEKAVLPNTKLFYLETPSNPLNEVADIVTISQIAKLHDICFVVDNCFCTPALQQPLKLGADIVLHSATKYIDGQGRCLGGVVAGNQQQMQAIVGFLRSAGPSLSPFNAWVMLKGLETLKIRMQAHSENAITVARWLQTQSKVSRIYYAGLESHPQHSLAKQQQSHFGGMLAFEIQGDRSAAWQLIDATNMLSITANLGDTKSTITHPATTTHGRLSDQERINMGISDSLIRVSCGLEDVSDIIYDIEQALAKI